jgi:hypothetical protein
VFILQQTKYTIHESNQKYFKNTQINVGRLQPWVRACDGEDSTGFRLGGEEQGSIFGWRVRGSGDELRAPVNSGKLRRRTATSGDERCTSDGERGELERGASSGRGESERIGCPFIERGRGQERSPWGRGERSAVLQDH